MQPDCLSLHLQGSFEYSGRNYHGKRVSNQNQNEKILPEIALTFCLIVDTAVNWRRREAKSQNPLNVEIVCNLNLHLHETGVDLGKTSQGYRVSIKLKSKNVLPDQAPKEECR